MLAIFNSAIFKKCRYAVTHLEPHNELQVDGQGVRARGPVTWIVGMGLAIAIALYGATQVSGLTSNTDEHAKIRTDLTRTTERVNDIDKKLDLIIQLLKK